MKDSDHEDYEEAISRYPWLAEENQPAAEEEEQELEFISLDNIPRPPAKDYIGTRVLTDDLLPTLDFESSHNIFTARPAGAYLKTGANTRPLRKLFSDFWHEGELSIFFADTGRGKSVLAVQIASSIAAGVPIAPFELETPPQRVIYFDFELTDAQFARRYKSEPPASAGGFLGDQGEIGSTEEGRGENPQSMTFPDNFIRCTPRLDGDIPYGFRDYTHFLTWSLKELIELTAARVVIVDNITWLNTSTENSTTALNLMKSLHALKRKHDLSILVLAHTPKRHLGSTITVNDMQGSKMLANFADNIFALGSSWRAPDLRYLKHLKPRNCPLRFDAQNVPVLRIAKSDGFLGFTFVEFAAERDQVDWTRDPDFDRKEVITQAQTLAAQGRKQREIAEELKIGLATVNRYLRISDD